MWRGASIASGCHLRFDPVIDAHGASPGPGTAARDEVSKGWCEMWVCGSCTGTSLAGAGGVGSAERAIHLWAHKWLCLALHWAGDGGEGMMMGDRFDIESRWPGVFEGLADEQRRNVVEALAANWHEGWVPHRGGVARLTALVGGDITCEEYVAQTVSAAESARCQ